MSPREDQGQGPVIRDRRRIDPATGQVRNSADPGPQRGPGNRQDGQQEAGGSGDGMGAPAGGQPRPGRHSASKPGSGPGGGEPAPADQQGGGADAPAPGPADGGGDLGAKASQAVAMLAERTADLQRLQAEYANYRKRVERDRLAVREQALASVLHELLPVLDDVGRAREHGELSGGFKSVAESLESIAIKLGLTAFGEDGDPFDPTQHEALMHEYSDKVSEPTAVRILQPGYRVGDRIIRPARVAVAEPGGEPAQPPATEGDEPGPPADLGDTDGDGNGV
jgi:molecular chaperone GrpE